MIHVVTGATGLIGRALVRALRERGLCVLALSRSAGRVFQSAADADLRARDFDVARDDPTTLPIDDNIALFMLASRITTSTGLADLQSILALDTYGHLRLAEAWRPRLRRVVYASSSTVYGHPVRLPVAEDAPLAPWNVYALAKAASEGVLRELTSSWDVPLTILRITQVYGPGAPLSGALYTFLQRAAGGHAPVVCVNPDAYRDYCHVDDVVRAVWLACKRGTAGTFNIGSGQGTSMERLARLALRVAGRTREPEIAARQSTYSMLLDIARARGALGYEPRIGIEDGLRREYQRLFPT
jgi:UDP-glucose 4-epimerase